MPSATKSRVTVGWVLGITLAGLIFDGYDLVVYGAVMPALREPGGLIFEALSGPQQVALVASAGVEPSQLTDAMREAIAAASTLGGALGAVGHARVRVQVDERIGHVANGIHR